MSVPSDECERCGDTGWVECDTVWCSDEGHGAYCTCPVGVERQLEESG